MSIFIWEKKSLAQTNRKKNWQKFVRFSGSAVILWAQENIQTFFSELFYTQNYNTPTKAHTHTPPPPNTPPPPSPPSHPPHTLWCPKTLVSLYLKFLACSLTFKVTFHLILFCLSNISWSNLWIYYYTHKQLDYNIFILIMYFEYSCIC